MKFLESDEAAVLRAVAALADGNPFLPERRQSERAALRDAYVESGPGEGGQVWHAEAELSGLHPNLPRLQALVEELAPVLRDRLARGARASRQELVDYEGLVRHLLYMRYEHVFLELILEGAAGRGSTRRVPEYRAFARDVAHFCDLPGLRGGLPVRSEPAHLFAWGYQIRRAFQNTFRQIFGGSMAAARLRAAVWQSIFTHDAQRYRRALHARMGDVPTLVTGASGTGKELVARAIGYSRFIPFDEKSQSFRHDFATSFHAVNLSALSPTLIESELFGHRRGAFTGAVEDRTGWLESCGPHGSVFLDEVGELDAGIQVKLLRVLQSRTFQRIGETDERRFEGKIIAATNRDLDARMASGDFRPDFYYRLCADRIETPTLREQISNDPEELPRLLGVLAVRIAGESEGPALAKEVREFVERELPDHPWPGNVRELEQCVRSVLLRGHYAPPRSVPDAPGDVGAALAEGRLSADALVRRYCTHVYARTGSYEEAARRLGLDRRTVKAKIDRGLLAELTAQGGSHARGSARRS